jgi:hypothetical protein
LSYPTFATEKKTETNVKMEKNTNRSGELSIRDTSARKTFNTLTSNLSLSESNLEITTFQNPYSLRNLVSGTDVRVDNDDHHIAKWFVASLTQHFIRRAVTFA